MAAPLTGPDTQSSTDQGPQVSGAESETSVSMRRVDAANHLNNITASMPPYNHPHHMFTHQQSSSGVTLQQMYPTLYQTVDSHLQGHYNHHDQQQQQVYNTVMQPSSNIHHHNVESENLYQPVQETGHHHGYQGYTQQQQQPVQDPTHHDAYSEYTNLQQQSYFQQVDNSYGQGEQQPVESTQVHRVVPRRLPHVRQRLRRRSRPTNRLHNSHVNSVAADVPYSTREHSTATSITGKCWWLVCKWALLALHPLLVGYKTHHIQCETTISKSKSCTFPHNFWSSYEDFIHMTRVGDQHH